MSLRFFAPNCRMNLSICTLRTFSDSIKEISIARRTTIPMDWLGGMKRIQMKVGGDTMMISFLRQLNGLFILKSTDTRYENSSIRLIWHSLRHPGQCLMVGQQLRDYGLPVFLPGSLTQ